MIGFDLGILAIQTVLKTSPAIKRNLNVTFFFFQKVLTFRNACLLQTGSRRAATLGLAELSGHCQPSVVYLWRCPVRRLGGRSWAVWWGVEPSRNCSSLFVRLTCPAAVSDTAARSGCLAGCRVNWVRRGMTIGPVTYIAPLVGRDDRTGHVYCSVDLPCSYY